MVRTVIHTSPYHSTLPLASARHQPGRSITKEANTTPLSKPLLKLLCAAIISRAFRHQLLTTPEQSLEDGYNGESFELTAAEQSLVLSVKAASIEEFSQQLVEKLEQGSHQEENRVHDDTIHRVSAGGD